MGGRRGETEGKVEENAKTDNRVTSSRIVSREKALWGHFTQQVEKTEGKEAGSKERSQSLTKDKNVMPRNRSL